MTSRRFYSQLAITSAATALVLVALDGLPLVYSTRALNWGSLAFFMALCTGHYYFGEMSLKSSNKHSFLQFFVGSVFLKMALCVVVILAYRQWAKPEGSFFIIPFFVIYLVFTVFEVYALSALSKKYS